jgi:hypothetical protein
MQGTYETTCSEMTILISKFLQYVICTGTSLDIARQRVFQNSNLKELKVTTALLTSSPSWVGNWKKASLFSVQKLGYRKIHERAQRFHRTLQFKRCFLAIYCLKILLD